MFRSSLRLLLVCALVGNIGSAPAAQITINADSHGCLFLRLSGPIDKETPARLTRLLDSPRCKEQKKLREPGKLGFVLDIEGPGGDLDSAMEVGRTLRKWQAVVFVIENERCASACVVALLGGVSRGVVGTIGLHRAYFTEGTLVPEEATRRYLSTRAKLEKYLQEMNIPVRLLDAMDATGPRQVRWLSGDRDRKELEELRIQGVDPVFEDLQLSRRAAQLNISKGELIHRSQQADAQCGPVVGPSRYDVRTRMQCHWHIENEGHYP